MTERHVIPDQRSTSRGYHADARAPLPDHTNATQPRLAPQVRPEDCRAEPVVVHDGYHRAHDASSSPAAVAPREQLVRARLLDRVRELGRAAR